MAKKQYLNEETYLLTKNKITIIATLVLVIGLIIGGGLIATGLIKNNQLKLSEAEKKQVKVEINNYTSELSSLKSQKHQESSKNGFSENYYNIENRIDEIEDKIDELEEKLNPNTENLIIFYIAGGMIIVFFVAISFVIYLEANGREIRGFYVQQQMPIAKEGINEIAPTIGNAVGEITKGLKDEDNK